MENQDIIVRIPEPCHEDWNKMTPDDKGKFCGSCCKSVIDFSNKTDLEIKTILMENAGNKICGHFKKTQVDRPLNIRVNFNELPKNMSVTRVFAVALFMVFGSFLFSCTDHQDKLVGKMEVKPIAETKQHILGEMPVTVVAQTETIVTETKITEGLTIKGDVMPEQVCMVMGGPMISTIVPDTQVIQNIEPMVDGLIVAEVVKDTTYDSIEYVKGKVKHDAVEKTIIPSEKTDSVIKVNEEKPITKPLLNNNSENIIEKSEFTIYPNPSKGNFTLQYDVLKRSDVRADVYTLTGSLVKTLVNVAGQYEGKYKVQVNFNELTNGVYLVNLLNGEKRSTQKLVIEK